MRSLFAPYTSLIIPTGAPPGTPRRVIGLNIPAELVAFYGAAPFSATVVSADLWQFDTANYVYDVLITTTVPSRATGYVSAGVVRHFSTFSNANLVVGQSSGVAASIILNTTGVLAANAGSLMQIAGEVTIDGTSAPRGFLDRVDAIANSANIVAETAIITGNGITWKAGRAMVVECSADILPITAAGGVTVTCRRTNAAGTLYAQTSLPLTSTTVATRMHWRFLLRNNTGADITNRNLCLTLTSTTANAVRAQGSAGQIYYMEIWDCAAAGLNQFTNVPQV